MVSEKNKNSKSKKVKNTSSEDLTIDRRRYSYTIHIPERRRAHRIKKRILKAERRSGKDRRSGIDRRSSTVEPFQ